MDIDKILRGQLSAVDVLREQAERQSALMDQIGASGAAHRRAIEAMQNPYSGYLARMDQIQLSATRLASTGLPRTYIDTLAMGGVSEQVYKRVMEAIYTPPSLSSRYPLPDVGSSLAALFNPPKVPGLAEALARLTSPLPGTHGLSEALTRLMGQPSDYQGISESLARLTGPQPELINSASRLASLFTTDVSSAVGRAAVRDSLGDWRDPIAFRPNIELPRTRLELYFDQGMSEDIIGVSAEDPDLQDYVETGLLDIADDGNVAAYRLLMHLEHALRQLIRISLEDVFGPHWWKQRVPPDVRDKCDGKLQEAVAAGAADTHPIDYADFTDYEKIICRSDNFKQAFKPVFGRVEDVRESLQRLHPVRLICMHSRIVTGADLILVQFEAPRILARVKPRLSK
tara:strand:- start:3262 stop:4461 length:1200 start_codon:yes stop_codon:yes gene_type:complete